MVALSALFLCGGITGLFARVFPIADVTPPPLIAWISVLSIALALLFWVVGATMSPRWIHALMLLGALGLAATVAASSSAFGIALAVVVYVWFSIYIGRFFSVRVARFYLFVLCAGLGIGLVFSDVERGVNLWPILAATLVVTVETMLRLSGQLRELAVHDPLTGLLNRTGLGEAARVMLASFRRTGLPVSLAVFDLDDFKAVNDRYGHVAGDRLLVELATCWTSHLRSGDILARFGGDEFILLMPDTDGEGAQATLARLDRCHHIEWSYGLVEFKADESLLEAIDRADKLLYLEKSQ